MILLTIQTDGRDFTVFRSIIQLCGNKRWFALALHTEDRNRVSEEEIEWLECLKYSDDTQQPPYSVSVPSIPLMEVRYK